MERIKVCFFNEDGLWWVEVHDCIDDRLLFSKHYPTYGRAELVYEALSEVFNDW